MSEMLQTVLAIAGLLPVAILGFYLVLGTLGAIGDRTYKASFYVKGFVPNFLMTVLFACAAITIVRAL